jgi:hypothetical protein
MTINCSGFHCALDQKETHQMTGYRTIVGLCMLCALAFSAIAAQGTAAVTKGTTAFTCKEGGSGFSTAHCAPGQTGTAFGHVAVAENTNTSTKVTNVNTNSETSGAEPAILKQTIAGVPLELKSTEVTSEGTMENKKDPITGEHFVEAKGTTMYKGVTVAAPAGKGCEVFTDTAEKTKGAAGVIDASIKATTTGQGDFGKLEPASAGAAFATFWIECTTKVPALEGTWEITGSVKCPTNGATAVCKHTETTEQNTLKGKGSKAGIELKTTFTSKDPNLVNDSYRPLSVTTVETP